MSLPLGVIPGGVTVVRTRTRRRRLKIGWKTYKINIGPGRCEARYAVLSTDLQVRTTMQCFRNRHKSGPHEFQVDINYDAPCIQWPDHHEQGTPLADRPEP